MAVTAQKIAELAGVSRGTVDRALHNRGRVNPEVAARIHKIAADLGYKPNLVGQALVKSKRDCKIGAILQSVETPTMQIVRKGLQRAESELRASGVELIVRELRGLDEAFAGRLLCYMYENAVAPEQLPDVLHDLCDAAV